MMLSFYEGIWFAVYINVLGLSLLLKKYAANTWEFKNKLFCFDCYENIQIINNNTYTYIYIHTYTHKCVVTVFIFI